MKKIIILLSVLTVIFIFQNTGLTQGYTPPIVSMGFTLDASLAMHDAYGTNFEDPNTYAMMWGRGIGIHGKIGLGSRGNHRIFVGGSYNKFVNSGEDSKSPITNEPVTGNMTNYNFWSGFLGYEYAFNARCRNKQFLGFGGSVTLINSQPGTIDFDDALRFGAYINVGYEMVLDPTFKTGLFLGLRYHLTNLFNHEKGGRTMNDGEGNPPPTFWRRVGYISVTLGFNFYLGTKMIKR